MNGKELCAFVEKLAAPIAEAAGCSVWDVEFVKEAGEWFLRVYIEAADGATTIDMCEAVSRGLEAPLDEADPIEQSYCLEVSSPGINRVLKRDGDFDRFAGSEVDVKLYRAVDGEKSFTALLEGRDGGELVLRRDGAELRLKKDDIAQCRLHYNFQ